MHSFSNKMKAQGYLLMMLLFAITYSTEAWVRVRNKGGYVARYFVDYHVVTEGKQTIYVGYHYPFSLFERTLSSGNYPIGQTRIIGVPRGAISARIRVERFIFYPFFGWYWKEIFRHEFGPQERLCFDIWGTTAQPSWTHVNC